MTTAYEQTPAQTQTPISNVPQPPPPVDLAELKAVQYSGQKVISIDVDNIVVDDSKNGRRYAPAAKGIAELAASIVERGQIQPVLVKRLPDNKYELLLGFRRVRAVAYANTLKMGDVPLGVNAVVVEANDVEALATNVAENAEREPLTPIDYSLVINMMVAQGLQKKDIATILKKSRPWVTEISQMGQLRQSIQRKIHEGKIPYTVARELCQMETDQEQDEAIAAIESGDSTGGDKRDKVRAKRRAKNQAKAKKAKGGKGDEGEAEVKISLTLREVRAAMEEIAQVGLAKGEEPTYQPLARAVALLTLKLMDGKISAKVWSGRVAAVQV